MQENIQTDVKYHTQNEGLVKKHRVLLLTIMIIVILLDQLSKMWVSTNLDMHKPINIFGDAVRLFLAHNPGIIWGLPVKSNFSYYILPIIGIIVVFYIAFSARGSARSHVRFPTISYGLILGGAIGNLLDRIRLGYVIDFIDMGIKNYRWPTYNIADFVIVIGLIMIITREVFRPKIKSKEINHRDTEKNPVNPVKEKRN